jgi:uncharacterized membrane protein
MGEKLSSNGGVRYTAASSNPGGGHVSAAENLGRTFMRQWVVRFVLAWVVGSVAATSVATASPNFEFIHDTSDYPGGLTADGSKAVINYGSGMAIWTRGGGTPLQPIAGLPGYQYTQGANISGDGTTIVGRSHDFTQGQRAFRWTAATGAQPIADSLGTTDTVALATNANGSVVVGYVSKPINLSDAWRWTAAGGAQRLAGYEAYDDTFAQDVSADGSVIVGTATTLSPGVATSQAFRWTEAGGFQLLPNAPGRSWGWGVSPDASTIVGSGEFTSGDSAFRWTATDGFEQFDHSFEYFRVESAVATSWDGSVIVGQAWAPDGEEAWIWDEQHGVRRLTQLAAEMGIDLGGQRLESATSISADGTIIAGRSFGPQGGVGYIMVVPEPATGLMAMVATAGAATMARRRRSAR